MISLNTISCRVQLVNKVVFEETHKEKKIYNSKKRNNINTYVKFLSNTNLKPRIEFLYKNMNTTQAWKLEKTIIQSAVH